MSCFKRAGITGLKIFKVTSYVTQGTVSFYLKKVKPFLEYKIVGNTPVQCWISRRSLFNFNFVRKEGTKCQFEAGNWMA